MSIQTIVFDFGNVIGFFDHRQALRQLLPYTAMTVEAMYTQVFGGELEDTYESGRMSTSEFLAEVRCRCLLRCDDAFLGQTLAEVFRPNEPVCAVIPGLRQRYRLLLGSNTNDLHLQQFRRQFAETLGHFHELVFSPHVGARKPNEAFFAYCQRLAQCTPAECLFIDDLQTNIAGARAFGWNGLLYSGFDDFHERLLGFGIEL